MQLSSGRASLVLALATLTVLVLLVPFRAPLSRVWADEGTYLAMADSLVQDGDLRFDDRDRVRLEAAHGGAATVILQRGEGGVAYSKPVLLSIFIAPLYALFGDFGLLLTNALVLGLALLMAHAYLLRIGASGRASLTLVTFVGASVLLPYVTWRMSDILQVALALAGLVLCFAQERTQGRAPAAPLQSLLSWRGAPYLGAALLGLVVSMRISNILLAASPILAALFLRQLRRAILLGVATVAPMLLMVVVTFALTGATNPYSAVRTSFTAETGYPANDGSLEATERFTGEPATHQTSLMPRSDLRRVSLSTLYFFIGRHTSLIFYFPAALALLGCALRRPDAAGLSMLLAFGGTVAFFLGWYPWNYFGGETFLGNRYLLTVYPALLVALRRLPGTTSLTLAWCLAALSYGSAMVSTVRHHDLDRSSQNHTYAGIFRLLPYESTAVTLTAGRDLYWSGHLVRFVDAFATPKAWRFELSSGEQPAEVMVAEWRPLDRLRLEVQVDSPGTVLHFQDYGRRESFALAPGPAGQRLDLPISSAWRRHLFWWNQEVVYAVRTFRLQLEAPEGVDARARIRYLGDPALAQESASYELLSLDLPEVGVRGGVLPVSLAVRNTSTRIWESEDVLPVHVVASFHKGRDPEPVFTTQPVPLPQRVFPGDGVEIAWDLPLPETQGAYRLVLDLAIPGEGPFANWKGRPLHQQRILARKR